MKTAILQQELHQLAWQWMMVSGIEIEEVTADENILRIRRFKYHHASGNQYAHNFSKHAQQLIERKMFDDMKACNCADAFIRQVTQIDERVFFNDFETSFPALLDLNGVHIYSGCFNTVLV